jgi:hypothetical protein
MQSICPNNSQKPSYTRLLSALLGTKRYFPNERQARYLNNHIYRHDEPESDDNAQ